MLCLWFDLEDVDIKTSRSSAASWRFEVFFGRWGGGGTVGPKLRSGLGTK